MLRKLGDASTIFEKEKRLQVYRCRHASYIKIAIGTHAELLKDNLEYQSYFAAQLKEDEFKE